MQLLKKSVKTYGPVNVMLCEKFLKTICFAWYHDEHIGGSKWWRYGEWRKITQGHQTKKIGVKKISSAKFVSDSYIYSAVYQHDLWLLSYNSSAFALLFKPMQLSFFWEFLGQEEVKAKGGQV